MSILKIQESIFNFFSWNSVKNESITSESATSLNEQKNNLSSQNRDSIVSEVDTSINERKSDLIPFLNSIDEATIYGYNIAGWHQVITLAKETMKNVYDYSLVTDSNKTLYDRNFIRITGSGNNIHKICKTTLTAIVIENCLRSKENKPLIPVVFCLTSNNCPYLLPIEVIANKNDPKTDSRGSISNSELRRIYKLCTDKTLPTEVRDIAKKTFIFAHVTLDNWDVKTIRKTAAPWENTLEDPNRNLKWKKARKAKTAIKSSQSKLSDTILFFQMKKKCPNWRDWLQDPAVAHIMLS